LNTRTEKQKRAFVNNVVLNPDVHEFLRIGSTARLNTMKALVDEAAHSSEYGMIVKGMYGATASAAVN